MPRSINLATAYRLVVHNTHGHSYASAQSITVTEDGKKIRRHKHYGVLHGNKFTPWTEFLILPETERAKFIFPPEWDLSELDKLSAKHTQGQPVNDSESQNRLYGDIWLLEQIAEKTNGYLYLLILIGSVADAQKDGIGIFEVSYPEVTAEKLPKPDFAQRHKADESNK